MRTRNNVSQQSSNKTDVENLGRLVHRLDQRSQEEIEEKTGSEDNHLYDILTEKYPELSEGVIKEEIERFKQEQNGGNPTEYASLGKAVEDKASRLENEIIQLHKTLDTEFNGRKTTEIGSTSEDMKIKYEIEAKTGPKELKIETYIIPRRGTQLYLLE